MGENSSIEWTDHTFNPWMGCTKVSPGCTNCYAERDMDHRYHKVKWGKGSPRVRTSPANWQKPRQWNAAAGKAGRRDRVFCASLADVFDEEVPMTWRRDLCALIQECQNLDWLLLTKRPQNVLPLLDECMTSGTKGSGAGAEWLQSLGKHVWLGTTVEDQTRADERIPHLLAIPASIRFLSCEPLLGPVDLSRWLWIEWSEVCAGWAEGPLRAARMFDGGSDPRGIHWIIAGGESGPEARPMHPEWATELRDQAKAAGVAFLFKQWGEWAPGECADRLVTRTERTADHNSDGWHFGTITPAETNGLDRDDEPLLYRMGKASAGRHLDGRTWDELPV